MGLVFKPVPRKRDIVSNVRTYFGLVRLCLFGENVWIEAIMKTKKKYQDFACIAKKCIIAKFCKYHVDNLDEDSVDKSVKIVDKSKQCGIEE